jgi:hypothetical protein
MAGSKVARPIAMQAACEILRLPIESAAKAGMIN